MNSDDYLCTMAMMVMVMMVMTMMMMIMMMTCVLSAALAMLEEVESDVAQLVEEEVLPGVVAASDDHQIIIIIYTNNMMVMGIEHYITVITDRMRKRYMSSSVWYLVCDM